MTTVPAVEETNAVIAAIRGRRSVRDGYVGQPIAREVLRAIVECGTSAPSSKNAQPWRFYVVDNRATLLDFASAVTGAHNGDGFVPHDPRTGQPRPEWDSTVRESAAVLAAVSAAVFVVNDTSFSRGRRELSQAPRVGLMRSLLGHSLELVGIGAAVQSMWLAANSLGVAAAFMGDVVIAEDYIRDRLQIEGDLIGVLALGYSRASHAKQRPAAQGEEKPRVIWESDR